MKAMNTNKKVGQGFDFDATYMICEDGTFTVNNGDAFLEEIARWNELTDDEKTACKNFQKELDKKYGKGKHEYKTPNK